METIKRINEKNCTIAPNRFIKSIQYVSNAKEWNCLVDMHKMIYLNF